MKGSKYNTSEQNITYVDYFKSKEIPLSMYSLCFLQDFPKNFSIEFSPMFKYSDFYFIDKNYPKLKKLLTENTYDFLRYRFDEILNTNMTHLLKYGKAYVKIVKHIDESGNLVSIDFVPFKYKYMLSLFNNIYYFIKTYDGKILTDKLSKEDVLVFQLSDLNYSKKYFTKIIKNLNKLNLSTYTLVIDESKAFDFLTYKKTEDELLLKYSQSTYWDGRKYDNPFITEPYFLYRKIKYKLLKKKFLDYLLKMYNEELQKLGKKYNFSGVISYHDYFGDYNELLLDLSSGNKSRKEISDELINPKFN